MLRGAESDGDAEYVSDLAKRLGITATLDRRDVKGYQKEHRLSLEEAARQVRYQFFADVSDQVGASTIAVGHTSDDQAETILMRLLRGTGTLGLQGMQPSTDWDLIGSKTRLKIIRPLLEASRKEVAEYCQRHALSPREDSSNLSPSHLRNRIRHELMPLLRSYNPKVDEALIRTAETLTTELDFLQQQVSLLWDKAVSEEGETLILETEELKSLHPALQRYLLREVVRRILGNLEDIEWKHIEQMRKALDLPKGKRVDLPRGLALYVEKGKCRVTAV